MTHLFRGDLAQAERFVSEALGSFRIVGNRRGEAWALQNLAWISFSHGDIPQAENRLEESADLFGELGDWGGLGWAYGLLAFVRYNQGRLDEAAALAEHIAIEGRETGNRWAVGMMDVLLAQRRAVERAHGASASSAAASAIALFQEIGDRWGEMMSTASVVRALAELGRREESETCLARLREIGAVLPSAGMHAFPTSCRATSCSSTAIRKRPRSCSATPTRRHGDRQYRPVGRLRAHAPPTRSSGGGDRRVRTRVRRCGVRRRRDEHGQPARARVRRAA